MCLDHIANMNTVSLACILNIIKDHFIDKVLNHMAEILNSVLDGTVRDFQSLSFSLHYSFSS